MSAPVSVAASAEQAPETTVEAPDDDSVTRTEVTTRPAPAPPLGVRFGEPLEEQRFRVGYSFDRIVHKGMLIGDQHVSPSHVLDPANSFNPYDRTPRSLEVIVHSVQLAYAPHPRTTLIVEVPFVMKELETLHASGLRTEASTEGIGDIGFALVVPFIRKGGESTHLHVGLDVPTGSIRRGGDESRLPFDSQIGNGTVDLEWGWTYRGEMDWLSWGGQVVGRHPVGRNGLEYREGSRFNLSFWGAIRLPAGWSTSLRLGWQKSNNTRVRESDFVGGTITDPSDNPKARGGTILMVRPGLTLELPQLGNQRIAVEFGIPVHQDLDGPQLKQDWSVKAGWQWGF